MTSNTERVKRGVLIGALDDVAIALSFAETLRKAADGPSGENVSAKLLSLAQRLENDALLLQEVVLDLGGSLVSREVMIDSVELTSFSLFSR